MKKGIKTKWLKALRSGKYKQTAGALRKTEGAETKYCCLGVLTDLYCKDNNISWSKVRKNNGGLLPTKVMEWAGIKENDPEVVLSKKTHESDVLSDLNDKGKSFKVIANLIEKNL